MANAARILGPDSSMRERGRLGRSVMRCFLDHVLEFAQDGNTRQSSETASIDRIRGADHYHAARAEGRGLIVVTAHLGPFESAVAQIRVLEPNVHVVFQRDADPYFESLRHGQRARLGVIEAPIDDGLATWIRLREALARNEVVLMQGDRTLAGQRGVSVPFLDGHVRIPTGPARLARLAGSPILPIFAAREDDEVLFFVERCIEVDDAVTDEQVCEQLGEVIARYVSKYPEQWLVLEKAWIEDQEQAA